LKQADAGLHDGMIHRLVCRDASNVWLCRQVTMPALSFSGFPAMKFRRTFAALAVTLLATALHAEETRLLNSLPKMVYGMLRQQGDRLMFAPCHERSTAIVEDVSVDGSVISILNSVGLAAGKRLYVELLGVFDNGTLRLRQ